MKGPPQPCGSEARKALVRASSESVNGIDYLEVDPADRRVLRVRFVRPLPGQPGGAPAVPLVAENVQIEGGERIQDVQVLSVLASGRDLTVLVDVAGDFSPYVLRLVAAAGAADPPDGFDPRLSAATFSFRIDCPSDFDCAPADALPPPPPAAPPIDYLAKDYASFRRLMLDRMSVVAPGWTERNPADLGVTLVETLAHAADLLSYRQDAVATEAYLGTARRRVSARRHARLLDYRMHDGRNARAWVAVETTGDGVVLGGPSGRPGTRAVFATRFSSRPTLDDDEWRRALTDGDVELFEPVHETVLFRSHNEIRLYAWGEDECCLPEGATRATLRDDEAARLRLMAGDVLVLEEAKGPASGLAVEADPARRWAVRLTSVSPSAKPAAGTGRDAGPLRRDRVTGAPIVEIAWSDEDALPFPLHVTAIVDRRPVEDVSVARGNVLLADHGLTIDANVAKEVRGRDTQPLDAEAGRWRPRLPDPGVAVASPYDAARREPASRSLVGDASDALPCVRLREGADGPVWEPRRDLLASGRFARHFVVETEADGSARLRFGDGQLGRAPVPGRPLHLTYRLGGGERGNVGAEAIAHARVDGPAPIARVRNPLSAAGGLAPETVEDVRRRAPQAFRRQERAVTEADYEALLQRRPDVQRASARLRWTGSWHTFFLAVDRVGGLPVDAEHEERLAAGLERYRLAGHDLEIEPPRAAPLDVVVRVCVKPGYERAAVRRALEEAFSSGDLPDGGRGFFHPDRWTFGQPLLLADVVATAVRVPGVRLVEVGDRPDGTRRFRRWGREPGTELQDGLVLVGPREIARADNDPSAPEMGRILFRVEGGL